MIPKTILDRRYYTNFDNYFIGEDYSCLLDFLPCYFHTKMFPIPLNKVVYQSMYINKDMATKFEINPVINYGGTVSFSVSYSIRRITQESNVENGVFYNTTSDNSNFVSYNNDFTTFKNNILQVVNQYPTSTFIIIFKLTFSGSSTFTGDDNFGEFLVYFAPFDSSFTQYDMPNVVSGKYRAYTSKIDTAHISNMIFNYLSLNEDSCFMVVRFDLQSYTGQNRNYGYTPQTLPITNKNIARCIALVGTNENDVVGTIDVKFATDALYGYPLGSLAYHSDSDERYWKHRLGFINPILLVFNTDITSAIKFYDTTDDNKPLHNATFQFLRYGYTTNVNDVISGFYSIGNYKPKEIQFTHTMFKMLEYYTGKTITAINFNDIGFHDKSVNYGDTITIASRDFSNRPPFCESIIVLLYLLKTGGIKSSTIVNNCGTAYQPNIYVTNTVAPQFMGVYSSRTSLIYDDSYDEVIPNLPFADLLAE